MNANIYLLMAILVASCGNKNQNSARITPSEQWGLRKLVNIHERSFKVLKVDGVEYVDVRGLRPYHIRVDNTNQIVFLQNDGQTGVVFHVYDLDTRKHTEIPVARSSLGVEVGPPPNGMIARYLPDGRLMIRSPDAKLNSREWGLIQTIILDLAEKQVISDETIEKKAK